MSAIIYTLCSLTALLCTVLLLRSASRSRSRMLFWSGLCFAGLTIGNVLLVIDRIVFPTQIDLSVPRLAVALVSVLLLIYGLIVEGD